MGPPHVSFDRLFYGSSRSTYWQLPVAGLNETISTRAIDAELEAALLEALGSVRLRSGSDRSLRSPTGSSEGRLAPELLLDAARSILPTISTRSPTYFDSSRSRSPVRLNVAPEDALARSPDAAGARAPLEPLVPVALDPAEPPDPLDAVAPAGMI
jgi:hypothetical protein